MVAWNVHWCIDDDNFIVDCNSTAAARVEVSVINPIPDPGSNCNNPFLTAFIFSWSYIYTSSLVHT